MSQLRTLVNVRKFGNRAKLRSRESAVKLATLSTKAMQAGHRCLPKNSTICLARRKKWIENEMKFKFEF